MKNDNIVKKAAHFNKENIEDKNLIEYIEKNSINFSALSKQLITQYRDNQIVTKNEVKEICRKITKEILEEYITSAAIENIVRKVLLETMINNDVQINVGSSKKTVDVAEDVIDKAVNSYTNDDLAAMEF